MPQAATEVILEEGCSAVSLDWGGDGDNVLLASGQLDGSIRVFAFDSDKCKLNESWSRHHKAPVRRVRFGRIDNSKLYSITSNKALTEWDVSTSKKHRCLVSAHDNSPYSLCPLLSYGTKHQCLATGDEMGVIKTWDMRAKDACISTYENQEEEITDLCMAAPSLKPGVLLATCADATVAAYDLRSRKCLLRSEAMHAELNAVDCCPTDGRTLVGAADGYIEIFNVGEWGNLINRFQSAHEEIDCLRVVNDELAITASTGDGEIRAVRLQPDQKLSLIGTHQNGVEELSLDESRTYLASCGYDDRIKLWNLTKLTNSIQSMNRGVKKRTAPVKNESASEFYEGLAPEKRSKEEGESDSGDEDGVDEGGSDDSDWESEH